MNDEAKILYLRRLYANLSEDITFLKVLLSKLVEDTLVQEKDRINRLLNAYIEERNRVVMYLVRFDEEIIDKEDEKKGVFEEYFQNKSIQKLSEYVFNHYQDDLLKIRDMLNSYDKEGNALTEGFTHLTPIEKMSLYQLNMDYFNSK